LSLLDKLSHSSKVEIIPWAGGSLYSLPGPLADANYGKPGGTHQALLGGTDYNIYAPLVHINRCTVQGTDGIYYQEPAVLLCYFANCFYVVNDCIGRFTVGYQYAFNIAIPAKNGFDL